MPAFGDPWRIAGRRFNFRDFYNAVLGTGAMPLRMLEARKQASTDNAVRQ